ncbi:tannase subunit [Ophiostoma piceae UAMH 11346]|uniref:Carboxylic ester hydrolase n=1 Tax=Ophiostoma piceae (strain UAMH 11346) TaxID=1262450 RepID=S3C8D7_OPHP1|nr:tannase subunit [Ophiostoma piceae UAMH 11346]
MRISNFDQVVPDISLTQGWTASSSDRGTLDIIWNSLFTIFLCGWTTICVNVPANRASWPERLFRKFLVFCEALAGPEFIFHTALSQYLAAKVSVTKFTNSGFNGWTLRHGFYAGMGGFILHSPDFVPFPLTVDQVYYLVLHGFIDFQCVLIANSEIEDKNKFDTLTRILTTMQLLWFVINVIARACLGMAITTLEISTIAFIFCTIFTCFFWRLKPQDVSAPIVLELKVPLASVLVSAGDAASRPYSYTPLDFANDDPHWFQLVWRYCFNIPRAFGYNFHPVKRPIDKVWDDQFSHLGPRYGADDFGNLVAYCADLSTLCTTSYVQYILPTPALVEGIYLLSDTVTTNPITKYSIPASWQTPRKSCIDFCNVNVAYTHYGTDDKVNIWFRLPRPESFRNRFLANGGGGYTITTAERSLSAGLVYGTITGTTDGGFGSWTAQLVDVLLRGSGSLNYNVVNFYGYRATHEMSIIGKKLTSNFYSGPNAEAAPGCTATAKAAPRVTARVGARLSALHLCGAVTEATHKYFPPNYELLCITRDAIDELSVLNGRIDVVASRSVFYKMHYDAETSVDKSYGCEATDGDNPFKPPHSHAIEGVMFKKAAAIIGGLCRRFNETKLRSPYSSTFLPPPTSKTRTPPITRRHDTIAIITVDTLKTWILQGI